MMLKNEIPSFLTLQKKKEIALIAHYSLHRMIDISLGGGGGGAGGSGQVGRFWLGQDKIYLIPHKTK